MINYGPGSFISVGGKKYALKQFHFHRPSEERINGKGYEMSVHLVHADQEGKVAVVAVLLQQGEDNPLVHELWNDLPKEKEKEEFLNNVRIDAARILPADRAYYTFPGSLTTPPCTENVTWFVLKHPVTVSATKIAQFSKLYRNDARPTQPLYGRVVLEAIINKSAVPNLAAFPCNARSELGHAVKRVGLSETGHEEIDQVHHLVHQQLCDRVLVLEILEVSFIFLLEVCVLPSSRVKYPPAAKPVGLRTLDSLPPG